MTHLTRSTAFFLSLLLLGSTAQAVTIVWKTVGNPGNANDVAHGGNPAAGAVATTYRIAETEVTNTQYTEFLNAVADTDTNALYHANMNSDARGGITQSGVSGSFAYTVKTNMGNKPVNYVSFWDSLRFANWMHNLQLTGAQDNSTTEDGAYTITPTGIAANSIARNGGATVFLPSENEWYKAAYYDPFDAGADAGTLDYWLYPTRSDIAPTLATANATGDISNPGTNVANYLIGADWNAQDGNVTTVGTAGAGSVSPYGTFDQGGNVFEWNETIISGSERGIRGSSWNFHLSYLEASGRGNNIPSYEIFDVGFRVASAVPEPSTFVLAALGLAGLGCVALRKKYRRA